MSHTTIWKEAVDKGYKRIAIFEDDVYFDPKFKERLNESMKMYQKIPNLSYSILKNSNQNPYLTIKKNKLMFQKYSASSVYMHM